MNKDIAVAKLRQFKQLDHQGHSARALPAGDRFFQLRGNATITGLIFLWLTNWREKHGKTMSF